MIRYGIETENSDIRVHVCVEAKKLYMYKTKDGLSVLHEGKRVSGHQPGIENVTSVGYLLRPETIPNCIEIKLSDKAFILFPFSKKSTTSEKGKTAEKLVIAFFTWLGHSPKHIVDKDKQIEGYDILLKNGKKVQVKCDYTGGVGGSGNLFLQTQESNPKGMV